MKILDRELESRGRGSITAMERALGQKAGWWHYRRKTGALQLSELLEILDYLGLDPALFVRAYLGPDHGIELNRPQGSPPHSVQRALERARSKEEGAGVGSRLLDTLDLRRYEKPGEVQRLLESMIDDIELELLPRALGILGSCLRLQVQLDAAEHASYAAIQLAFLQEDYARAGNLLRWMSYITGDKGNTQLALEQSEQAMLLLLRQGDLAGVSKAIVEQGIWLYYLGRWEESTRCLDAAFPLLPKECARYHCSALQVRGLCSRASGDLEAALSSLLAAETRAEGLGTRHAAKLQWLRAEIYLEAGEFSAAEDLLWQVLETLGRSHHGEAVLVTCDLVCAQLELGEVEKAYLTATSMRALVEHVHKDPILSGAIAELLRAGQEGLNLALVERVRARIETQCAEKLAWASHRVAD